MRNLYSFRSISAIVLGLALVVGYQSSIAGQESTQLDQVSTASPAIELFKIKVSAGKFDRKNTLVDAPIWYDGIDYQTVVLVDKDGKEIVGQISSPHWNDFERLSLADQKKAEAKQTEDAEPSPLKIPARLNFVLPELAAGETLELTAKVPNRSIDSKFAWHDDGSTKAELQFNDNSVVQYMYEAVDEGSPERRAETYKVFHHIYSPDGRQLLTKGAGGLFPHHRGLFFGYNRITYGDGQKADVWHCKNGESQVNQKSTNQTSPVCARSLSSIAWNGQDGNPFAIEQRELTVFKVDGATVIDVRTSLSSLVGPIKLAGDPQHAGVQFRASQDVPDHTKSLTYYIRPDGKAEPGKFRNWSNNAKETAINKSHINLPWLALCMALKNPTSDDSKSDNDANRFTICYLNSAANPSPSRFSERDYGRFGCYCETTVDTEKPLFLHYRYWIVEGEMKVEQVQNLSDQFSNPVEVELFE